MDNNTTTVNGVTYCNFCCKELQNGEECDCAASQRAAEKAKKKAERAKLNKHNEKPPRRKTLW